MNSKRGRLLLISGVLLVLVLGVGGWALVQGFAAPQHQLLVVNGQTLALVADNGVMETLADDVSADLFRYPTPAPDGQSIAYISSVGPDTMLTRLNLRTGDRQELYRSSDSPALYVTWSPDGGTLSFLTNLDSGGLGVNTVTTDGAAVARLIETTSESLYFAWRPDSSRLLLHTGGSVLQDGKVSVYRPGDQQPLTLLSNPGFFQAPAWSSDGESFFYVMQPPFEGNPSLDKVEGTITQVAASGGEPRVVAREPGAFVLFSRAPTSDQIAYTTLNQTGFGSLKIVDSATADVRTLSQPADAVAAFFWSPDSSRVAYLTLDAPTQRNALPRYTWHVATSSGDEQRDFDSFRPSQKFAGMLSFFDAYAFSFTLWSPDSAQITYGADDGIYVIDLASGATRRVGDGELSMWIQRSRRFF